jgi:uncharacterized protein (DUF305 family)
MRSRRSSRSVPDMTAGVGVKREVIAGAHLSRVRYRITIADWRAAALLGLISSSFSTLASQLTAARIGRDASVDWMTVANIPLRDAALHIEPTATSVIAGILFHQWADFSWAIVFFGVLGRWTSRLSPQAILLVVAPWALFTSATEWLLLVPLVPFRQPVFPLEQPYWIGFLVHLSSALIYPLFPWLRDRIRGKGPARHARFSMIWGGLAVAGLATVGVLAYAGSRGHELPWFGHDEIGDQTFMRHMSTHHAQGILVAGLAAKRAQTPHLRALARLMAAEQIGENRIFAQWWASWFATPSQICSQTEKAAMPGYLTDAQIDELRQAEGSTFDQLFVELMTTHHLGAVKMADDELRGEGDPRLRIMAQTIRHGQQGEIELMRGTHGLATIKAATGDMFSVRLKAEHQIQ